MQTDTTTLSLIPCILAAMGILLKIHHRNLKTKTQLKISLNYGRGVNEVRHTTYPALLLTISNTGVTPAYVGGAHAISPSGEIYYPSLIFQGERKLDPSNYLSAKIPIGHLLNPSAKQLWIDDGTGKKHKIPTRVLKKAQKYFLQSERSGVP